jgi:hypothetical protein
MPNYGQKCLSEECGFIFNDLRPMAQSHVLPPCPKCGATTEREYSPITTYSTAPAVVVFKAPDGTFRYPGQTEGKSVEQYVRLGYERMELRGFADVRRFERDVNTEQSREIAKRAERQMVAHLEGERRRRSDVYNGMANGFVIPVRDKQGRQIGTKVVRLSPAGMDTMRNAMAEMDRRPRPQAREAGFFVDAYSNDRGSRDESRRSDGKRFRD